MKRKENVPSISSPKHVTPPRLEIQAGNMELIEPTSKTCFITSDSVRPLTKITKIGK